ncbi:helix-turn-helix domain-containing protein [Anaerosinus massiliensis]|uniref:helix-turn-helix domain-containing protein n=1 Tax=Massilibacillus massiliensis TaxID=1806837 RepID=UPI000AAFFBCA|nr:helix-turn-helix transcriptional regulator [Massilibacillus massiliensis]
MRSIVADRLKMARIKKGLTQTEVYRLTGINNKTLSGYENQVSEPDLETLKVLSNLYGVKTDYLLGVETITTNHPNKEFAKILTDNQIEKLEVTKDISIEELKKIVEFYHTIKINKE